MIPDKKKEKALELVKKRFEISESYQKPIFNNFSEFYSLYRNTSSKNKQKYNGKANLFVPYCYSIIEDTAPRLVSSKPKFYVYPRGTEDENKAKVIAKVIDYYWYNLDMEKKLKSFVKQGLIYGTSFLKLTWSYDEDTKEEKPQANVTNVFDIFVDPDCEYLEEAKYIIHRVWRNLEDLREDSKYKISEGYVAGGKQQSEFERLNESVLGRSQPEDKDKNLVELLEYWGEFEYNGKIENYLIVMMDKTEIIRCEPMPYKEKPFSAFYDVKVPKELWGTGEIEPIVSLQYELNDIRNQRMDNVTQILANRPAYDASRIKHPYEVENWLNGGLLGVMGSPETAVGFFRPPDVTASSYNEETLVKADFSKTTGISDLESVVGGKNVTSVSQSTATGAAIQQEEQNSRLRLKLSNLEDALVCFGKQLLDLLKENIDTPKIIRIIGEGEQTEMLEMKPELFEGEFDVIIEAGATQTMNKQVKRNETLQMAQTLAPYVGSVIKPDWFIKNILKSFDVEKPEEAIMQQPMSPMGGQPGQPAQAGQPPMTEAEAQTQKLTSILTGNQNGNRTTTI